MLKPIPDPLMSGTLALKALAFIAGRPEILHRFLASSGADPASLRARADHPETLVAVLDFLLANEDLLAEFCSEQQIDFRSVHLAAARLGS
ncbi:MAG: DUF3572 domain-containing protein [Alphaproteobacteria bacterium]|nr:DUF3572 domain-containing protein [Alphaproteobacteria bacterium]